MELQEQALESLLRSSLIPFNLYVLFLFHLFPKHLLPLLPFQFHYPLLCAYNQGQHASTNGENRQEIQTPLAAAAASGTTISTSTSTLLQILHVRLLFTFFQIASYAIFPSEFQFPFLI